MSVALGSKSRIAYAEETVFGTFPNVAAKEIGLLSEGIEQSINTFVSDEIRSDRQVSAIRGGNKSAGGDINMELSPNVLGTFLKHLLMCTPVTTTLTPTVAANSAVVARGDYISVASGARRYLVTRAGTLAADISTVPPTSTDKSEEFLSGTATLQYFGINTDTIYQHVFTANTVRPTGGLAMEKTISLGGTNQMFQYVGGRVNSLSMTIPQEGIITAVLSMIFLKQAGTPTATGFSGITTPTDDPFAGSQALVFILPPGSSTRTDDTVIRGFNLSVNNNFDGNIFVLGSRFRKDLVEGRRDVTGSFEAWFESMTQYNYFNNESIIGLIPTFNLLGQYMEIEIPAVKLTGGSPTPKIAGTGVISSSYNFQAFNNGGAYDIKVTLRNTTVSY